MSNLKPFVGDVYHLAPVPIFYKEFTGPETDALNAELIRLARARYEEQLIEVPDERHVDALGSVPKFEQQWSEEHPPAVGIWHRVPTNAFLELDEAPVKALRARILDEYVNTLRVLEHYDGRKPLITESWMQFYKNGDKKVLHNHERYDKPFYERMWAGGYYVSDGQPDPAMKYAGVLSFRIRETNYFFRPKAGMLMMWPADILHEVHPFYGRSERVVINFNLCLEEAVKSTRAGMLVRKLVGP